MPRHDISGDARAVAAGRLSQGQLHIVMLHMLPSHSKGQQLKQLAPTEADLVVLQPKGRAPQTSPQAAFSSSHKTPAEAQSRLQQLQATWRAVLQGGMNADGSSGLRSDWQGSGKQTDSVHMHGAQSSGPCSTHHHPVL